MNALTQLASQSPDFVHGQKWCAQDSHLHQNQLFFTSQEAIDLFSRDPEHIQLKRKYSNIYNKLQITLTEVQQSFGPEFFPLSSDIRSN